MCLFMCAFMCHHFTPYITVPIIKKIWLKTYFKEIPLALLFVNQFVPLNLTQFLLHYKGMALLTGPPPGNNHLHRKKIFHNHGNGGGVNDPVVATQTKEGFLQQL